MKKKAAVKKKAAISRPTRVVGYQIAPADYLSTGSWLLDLAISCNKTKFGGIPTNRIAEFSGSGASGKTYVCGELAGGALRKDYIVYVDDIERRWDLSRLSTFGFDLSNKNFHYWPSPSSHIEMCFDRMFKAIDKVESGSRLLYIVDPIAALYSKVELERSDKMGQARAKAAHRLLRRLKDRFDGKRLESLSVVFSNQLIDKVGAVGAMSPSKTTPLGNAMIHWPSIRVEFKHMGKIKKEITPKKTKLHLKRGLYLKGTVAKNSEDDPFRDVVFSVVFGYGLDNLTDAARWLKSYTEDLDVEDATDDENERWYQFDGKVFKSLRKFIAYVESNNLEPDLKDLLSHAYRSVHQNKDRRKPKYS